MNHDDVSPPGSPNIVVVYMDDMGCSDIGCFGSEIETPHLDALAARGLRLNHYTTQPICSPARAALLSGRNAHAVSSGSSASGATRPMPQRPSPRTEQYYECRANLVHPLDNRSTLQKFNQLPPHQKPAAAGTRRFLPGGQSVHRQRVLPLIADRSFQVSLRVRHGVDDEGVLFAIGDVIGGMVMYLEGGALHLTYNGFGEFSSVGPAPVDAGERDFTFEFEALGRRRGRARLVVDGTPVTDWAGLSPMLVHGFHEGLDIGIDRRAPVDWSLFERRGTFAYSGRIAELVIASGPFAADSAYARDCIPTPPEQTSTGFAIVGGRTHLPARVPRPSPGAIPS